MYGIKQKPLDTFENVEAIDMYNNRYKEVHFRFRQCEISYYSTDLNTNFSVFCFRKILFSDHLMHEIDVKNFCQT